MRKRRRPSARHAPPRAGGPVHRPRAGLLRLPTRRAGAPRRVAPTVQPPSAPVRAAYLHERGLDDLQVLSPVVISGFLTDRGRHFSRSSVVSRCVVLRVFLCYLDREGLVGRDLSHAVDSPRIYRLATVPRSIQWDEVRRMLEVVERRTVVGRRDYAMLLLLVTDGLRAREVAALTLDDIDWSRERLRIPERKAGHSTAYPLSPLVGKAISLSTT